MLELAPKDKSTDKVQEAYLNSDVDWNSVLRDFNGFLKSNPGYSKKSIALASDTLAYIDKRFADAGFSDLERNGWLGLMILETLGRPSMASTTGPNPTYYGLLLWNKDRLPVRRSGMKGLDDLINLIIKARNTPSMWYHGGKGTGFNSGKEGYKAYSTGNFKLPKSYNLRLNNLNVITYSITNGYVMPANRVAETLMRSTGAKLVGKYRKK